jgi:hypothetical protein
MILDMGAVSCMKHMTARDVPKKADIKPSANLREVSQIQAISGAFCWARRYYGSSLFYSVAKHPAYKMGLIFDVSECTSAT